MRDFDYRRPAAIDEAVSLLASNPEALPLAGGQSLIVELKQRATSASMLVDLAELQLDEIKIDRQTIYLGAMTTHAAVASSRDLQSRAPGLCKMAGLIGDLQVRNCGTVGGSLAYNSPVSCYSAAVLGLGATIITHRRRIAADDFFKGPFATALEPGELIVGIEFSQPGKSNYEKIRNSSSRAAIVGVFVAQSEAGARVAVTGASQKGVFRQTAMEDALSENFTAGAIAGVTNSSENLINDIHASAEYRAHLVGVLARRCVAGTVR
jgi:aerobic carbon-monoxide dehydrogenase medium subunit